MQLKDTYQEKLETQLKEWNAKIGELRSRAERVATGARVKYQEEVEALRFRYEGAQRKLQELKQAGEGVWEDLRRPGCRCGCRRRGGPPGRPAC